MREGLPTAEAVKQHMAGRLRLRRVSMGLSQENLAWNAGLSVAQIGKYERGIDRIPADRLFHFSVILRCAPGHFFADMPVGDHQAPDEDEAPRIEVDRDRLEMLRQFERCPEYVRTGIRSMIRHCAKGRDHRKGGGA